MLHDSSADEQRALNADRHQHTFRLSPLICSDLVTIASSSPWDIRTLDMRAAPYDLWTWGSRTGAPPRARPVEECERLPGSSESVAGALAGRLGTTHDPEDDPTERGDDDDDTDQHHSGRSTPAAAVPVGLRQQAEHEPDGDQPGADGQEGADLGPPAAVHGALARIHRDTVAAQDGGYSKCW